MSDIIVRSSNFCSDLNLTSKLISAERCLMYAPLTDEICSGAKSCRLGALVTMIDVAASDPVLAAWAPDWTATQDLSVNTAAPLLQGPVVVDARLLRVGRKTISVATRIYDGLGIEDLDELQIAIDATAEGGTSLMLCGNSLATFARISRSAASGVDYYNPNVWLGKVRKRNSDRRDSSDLYARIGLIVHDGAAGSVSITNSPYVANSIGTINGGVQSVVVEAAAEAMRPGMIATDIHIHYLSQLKVGPVHSRGTVIRDARDHSVLLVQLIDVGADDRILATATVTMQPCC